MDEKQFSLDGPGERTVSITQSEQYSTSLFAKHCSCGVGATSPQLEASGVGACLIHCERSSEGPHSK